MRHPREWFATRPHIDEDTERPKRWWHWNREWYGGPGYGPDSRWRLCVGDIVADMESDTGEPAGAAFGIDLHIWEDTGQFSYDNADHWHDHSVSVIFWRWGVYFAWRGGLKAPIGSCESCRGTGVGYGQVPDGRWMETDCGVCDGSGVVRR